MVLRHHTIDPLFRPTVSPNDSMRKRWKVKGNFPRTQLFGITSDRQGIIIFAGNRSLLTSSDGGKSFEVPEIIPPIKDGWIYGINPRGSEGFATVGKEGWI